MTCENDMVAVRLNITIQKDTLGKLKEMADKEHRTVSNMISHLVEQAYEYKDKVK